MTIPNFTSPHCHPLSLDSGSTVAAMVEREIELETGAVCCTDHGSMGACREVYDLAKKKGLAPILGCEIYFRDDQDPILAKAGIESVEGKYNGYAKYFHATIHALDQPAFEAMSRVLSRAWLNRTEKHGSDLKPIFDWNDLEELGQYNITFGTGCLVGMIQRNLLLGRPDVAMAYFKRLRGIAKPGNLYVEIFPHHTTHQWVDGTFLHFADGTRQKVWAGKKFRTNASEEITAEAMSWDPKPHTHILGIKNRSTWEIYPEPKALARVETIQGFMANECTAFAPDGDTQRSCNRFMLELARRFKVPALVSDDAHFSHPEDKVVQDIRLSDGPRSWKFYASYHRFSGQEAFEHFRATLGINEAQFEGWVENSKEFASRFKDFSLDHPVSLPAKFYPPDSLKYTYELIEKHGRMDWNDPVMTARLKEEITLFHENGKLDLLTYFQTCEDVIEHCQKEGDLTGPGRGSSGGVLLNYLLEVTHVHPLQHELSLDRFITPDRIASGKMPDVDMDFPNRDLLVDPENGYCVKRYGDHFAQISVLTTMRLKSSMKDVARARLGFVPKDIEDWCSRLPTPPQGITDTAFVFGYTADDGTEVKGLVDTSPDLQEYIKKYPADWENVKKCLAVPRQYGRHASAFVIANEPIAKRVPLMTVSGVPVTQYTAPSVEASGFIKFDFLGLNTLNDIRDCLRFIRARSGRAFEPFYRMPHGRVPLVRVVPHRGEILDVWRLPEDEKVFEEIGRGKTETVFQFNTNSARQWLREFNHRRPDGRRLINSIDDMAVFTALDRPGPLDAYVGEGEDRHNMLQEYARRARGEDPTDFIPALQEILPETYGIMAFQEGLQKVYAELTGCSRAEAEEFRSNVAKKKVDKVEKAYGPFIEKASQRVGKETAEKIFQQIKTFGSYGFCMWEFQGIETDCGVRPIVELAKHPGIYRVMYRREDGTRGCTYPVRVWQSGTKEVKVAILANGATVAATDDHQFYSSEDRKWYPFSWYLDRGEMATDHGWTSILSVNSIGVQPVYDMEMPFEPNFYLPGGVLAHNCKAHAVAYSYIAYACAWLKHHYPLEWWCAVLKNADKEKVYEQHWAHCGHLVDMPDANHSEPDFVLRGDRIKAPLGFLKGVGPKAQEELAAGRPYKDIQDFCDRIRSVKDATKTTDPETGKVKAGRSALNKGVVGDLIITGVLDSLFEPGLTDLEKIQAFHAALAISMEKKKPEPVDPKWIEMDLLGRYQYRKKVLPIHAEDIRRPACVLAQIPGLRMETDLDSDGNPEERFYYDTEEETLRVVSGTELRMLSGLRVGRDPIRVAAIAYVLAARTFDYGKEVRKRAVDFTLDLGGVQTNLVLWPPRNGRIPNMPVGHRKADTLVGGIVLLTLNRYRDDRPFGIDSIQIIRLPLENKNKGAK